MPIIGERGMGAIVAVGMTGIIGFWAVGVGWLDSEPTVDGTTWIVSVLTTSVAIGAVAGRSVLRTSRARAVVIGFATRWVGGVRPPASVVP